MYGQNLGSFLSGFARSFFCTGYCKCLYYWIMGGLGQGSLKVLEKELLPESGAIGGNLYTSTKNSGNEKISIIIIAYNEEKFLPLLLASLENQTYKDFEIIVVDSNSVDNTIRVYKDFEGAFRAIRLLQLGCAKGPAYARNKGAELAKYNRLLFLDADTVVKNDFLELLVTEFAKKKTDVGTCRLRVAENKFSSNLGAKFLNAFMIALKPIYSSAYGACFISTKEVHMRLNGFVENLSVCEDCNYVKRARRLYNYKYGILKPYFFTSDRRAEAEGSILFMFKYIRIHLKRLVLGKELLQGEIAYNYGDF